MQRSGKFYRKNEQEVMQSLGLDPTPNSGSGWVVKEDGQNDNVICQLKSTDANSIKVSKHDLDTLVYNATVTNKLPVFAIQFLQSREVYLLVKPEQLVDVAKYIDTGKSVTRNQFLGVDDTAPLETISAAPKRKVTSSASARETFRREQQNKYKKKERYAK